MDRGADIVVFDESGQTIVLVQVKAVAQSSAEWAAQVRRETFPRNPPAVPFFLVVARDKTYIWTRADAKEAAVEVSTSELLRAYLEDTNMSTEKVAPSVLELITGSWLIDLTVGRAKAATHPAVRESGLSAAVQDGRIQFAAAA